MKQTSTNMLLLGIALLLFGIALPTTVGRLLYIYMPPAFSGGLISALILSIFPIAGLVVVCTGFLMRNHE